MTAGFHSAADPEISFDGERFLFAGKKRSADHWQIYEAQVDGSGLRQLTREPVDCRHPIYQSRLFVLDSERPWYQVAFVREADARADLYSIHLDGSGLRRLTYNLGRNYAPTLMPDGRMVFGVEASAAAGLFGINLDGTDYALFTRGRGARVRMLAVTAKRLAVYVESDRTEWDGSGRLAAVSLRRSLHSHRVIAEGLFHSPSALPDGAVLVSLRTAPGATHALYRLDPDTGSRDLIFDDPDRHDVQAHLIAPRAEPDGRSSVVDENIATAKLYCLSVYTSDVPGVKAARRLRVIAGGDEAPGGRVVGEVALEADGSFNLEIPANTPMRLQLLDAKGVTLRSTPWIWSKNKENRGCIGCHENGELTPENRLATALTKPSVHLTVSATNTPSTRVSTPQAQVPAAR